MRKYYEIKTGSDNFLNPITTDNGLAYDGFVIDLNTGEISVSDQWRENWLDWIDASPRLCCGIFDYLEKIEIETSYIELDGDTILHITLDGYTYTYTYTDESLIERLVTYGKANLEIAY